MLMSQERVENESLGELSRDSMVEKILEKRGVGWGESALPIGCWMG